MSDLIYPTLDLFLYDSRNSLGETKAEINNNRQSFLKKLPETIHQTLLKNDKYDEAESIDLLGKVKIEHFENSEQNLKGYYYPVRLNDTYGLLLDCSFDNFTESQPASIFATLKAEIEQKLKGKKATLGQTWMLSGYLPNSPKNSPEDIAKLSYEALIPDSNWQEDLEDTGNFLGATIFELFQYRILLKEDSSSVDHIQSIQENIHIIIAIYPNLEAAKKASNFYRDWIVLFSYRHKILWAYGQSRVLKQSIKNYYSAVEEQLENTEQKNTKQLDFSKAQETLIEVQRALNHYTADLKKLDFQASTIDINLGNYKKRLEKMQKRAGEETDLKFLNDFTTTVTEKYQLQIHKDTENLDRALKLLNDTVAAVKIQVEIEKAKGDSNFQELITIVGVGWAVGSFVAQQQPTPKSNNTNLGNAVQSLIYPAGLAITAAFFFWVLKRLWQRSYFLSKFFDHYLGELMKMLKK